jgi:hypothetical protein
MVNPGVPAHIWALMWIGVRCVVLVQSDDADIRASLFMLILFIIAALAAWRQTPHGMYCQVGSPSWHVPVHANFHCSHKVGR